MLNVLVFAAASFLTSPVDEIVLRSGQVIPVEELVRMERGRLIFSTSGGNLYSLRLSELDIEKTDARLPANRTSAPTMPPEQTEVRDEAALPRNLPVSAEEKKRILSEMEARSHTGQRTASEPSLDDRPAEPTKKVESSEDEQSWRDNARRHREAVERAQERLESARQSERELNDLLLMFAGSTGDATNYSYLVVQLADLRSMIPQLEAEVRRAESAWAQFRDDARIKGVLPGWLR